MVAAPEPRLLTVQPFDKSLAQAIEKAIRDADLGLNPATQGNLIRVPLPALSEERRKELVKVVHKLAEEGRDRRPPRPHRRDLQDQEARAHLRATTRRAPRRTSRSSPTTTSSRSTASSMRKRPRSWKSDRMSDDLLQRVRVHGAVPTHVAIIMDGNGRWAAEPLAAAAAGPPRRDERGPRGGRGVPARPGSRCSPCSPSARRTGSARAGEIEALMSLLEEYIAREMRELREQGVAVRILGDLDRLAPAARERGRADRGGDRGRRPAGAQPLHLLRRPRRDRARGAAPRGGRGGRPARSPPRSTRRRSRGGSTPRSGPIPIS